MAENYLDDLLEEMIIDHKQRHPSSSSPTNSFLNLANANNNNISNSNHNSVVFKDEPDLFKKDSKADDEHSAFNRKSRMSKIPGDHFDYLETLLSDMSASDGNLPPAVQTDQQEQDSRIKLLRLTSTFDLESTLMDLESFYWKYTQQSKRTPSVPSDQPPPAITTTPAPAPATATTTQPPKPTPTPVPTPSPAPVVETKQTTPSSSSTNVSKSTGSTPLNMSQSKRGSNEKVSTLTREAIDVADTLDQMINSFIMDEKSQPSTTPAGTGSISKGTYVPYTVTSGTGTIRPAAKLNAPVDIASATPKPPTPIATLSASPINANAVQNNSSKANDKLLDDMISQFKDSNSNLKFATHDNEVQPKNNYLSQQHYTLAPDDIRVHHLQKQQSADEDLVQRILCDGEIEEKYTPVPSAPVTEKTWYIKQELNTKEVIGYGNHGMTARAGIYKEKRIVGKQWNFITPQSTPILFNEIETLVSIKHPNILSLMGASMTSSFNTFTEYITGNNLDLILKSVDEKSELPFIIRVSEEIASALSFLHSFNVVHRSLHPKNVILNSDLKVYIKDYGFAGLKDDTLKKKLMNPINNQILYPHYLAPELFHVLNGGAGGYDTKVDVFSFGVMMWEMFSRETKLSDLKCNVVNGYSHYVRPSPPNCPFTIDKLIRLCLSIDPSARPSFQTILKVLRQPLHTLQRYQKPANEQTLSPNPEMTSPEIPPNSPNYVSPAVTTQDLDRKEKMQKILTLCRDLISSPTLSNLTRAANAIESLAQTDSNYPYLLSLNIYPIIIELLSSKFEEILLITLRSLNNLLANEDLANQFRNMMGINTILQLIQDRSENIKFATIRVLQTLAHKDANIKDIVAKGGIPILIRQLTNQNELVRLQIVWCLTMLLESNEAQDELIKMGGAEILVDMFVNSTNDGFDLRVASSLSRILPSKYTQNLINDGSHRERILQKYITLLDSNHETLRMLGLEAVATLVASNKDNQSLIVSENNVVPLLIEYIHLDYVSIAPQMTAIKILLLLASQPKHVGYIQAQNITHLLEQLKNTSPHPSIQKASERILLLIK